MAGPVGLAGEDAVNTGKEGETGMDLVERYLKAVAAQLPKGNRDDIVAELRDEIMGRLEALWPLWFKRWCSMHKGFWG